MNRFGPTTCALLMAGACTVAARPDAGDGTGADASRADGSTHSGFDAGHDAPSDASGQPCRPAPCHAGGSGIYACGNCLDDDGDGLTDDLDPDCYGPCDENEDYFAGIVSTSDSCNRHLECLFNFGRGDCRLSRYCYGEEPCAMDLARCEVDVDAECLAWCMPYVPNGCDCFGCCEVPGGSGAFVRIRNEPGAPFGFCSMATLDDPVLCRACTPTMECFNPCESCELCMGRRLPPAGCTAEDRCGAGVQPCSLPGEPPCPENYACIGGCCAWPTPTF